MPITIQSGITIGPAIIVGDAAIQTTSINEYLTSTAYTGSGTTWTATNGTNATLVNAPTYTSTGANFFSFAPASFQYATVPNPGSLSRWTVEVWLRVTSSLTGQVTSAVTGAYDLISNLNFSIGTNNSPTSYNLVAGFFDGSWHNTSGFAPTLNTWYHVVGTYDGSAVTQYVNGVVNSTLNYVGTPASGGEIRIARRWDSANNDSTNFFPGDIAVVRIYSVALTAAQIFTQYVLEKNRFSI